MKSQLKKDFAFVENQPLKTVDMLWLTENCTFQEKKILGHLGKTVLHTVSESAFFISKAISRRTEYLDRIRANYSECDLL